jgi:Heterokaryon incompatibility protein (HET)
MTWPLVAGWKKNNVDNHNYLQLPSSPSYLQLPAWRWKLEYDDEATNRLEWDNTIDSIGIDIPKYPFPLVSQQMLWLPPRFRWGDFEAISYCWESDVRERKIVINETVLDVPKNLEAVLQRLRQLPDTKFGMKFWIDALCINQNDFKEKDHQVQLMRSIYTKAFAVIVLLGNSSEDSNKAINSIVDTSRFVLWDEKKWEETGKDANYLRNHLRTLPWKEILSLFSRNYWRRLWIIQELALNHNMTLFSCGDRLITRSMILRTSESTRDIRL